MTEELTAFVRSVRIPNDTRGLRVRLSNCLYNANITSMEELRQLSDRDLLRVHNFGKKLLSIVRRYIPDPTKGVPVESTESKLWQKFDRGDPLTDHELHVLINSAEEGLRYLQARGERFVSFKTIMDLETLRGFQRARREK